MNAFVVRGTMVGSSWSLCRGVVRFDNVRFILISTNEIGIRNTPHIAADGWPVDSDCE